MSRSACSLFSQILLATGMHSGRIHMGFAHMSPSTQSPTAPSMPPPFACTHLFLPQTLSKVSPHLLGHPRPFLQQRGTVPGNSGGEPLLASWPVSPAGEGVFTNVYTHTHTHADTHRHMGSAVAGSARFPKQKWLTQRLLPFSSQFKFKMNKQPLFGQRVLNQH